jgi:hypothetical protein
MSQSSNLCAFSYYFHPVLSSVNPQGAKSPLCMNRIELVCSESFLHPLDLCAAEMKVNDINGKSEEKVSKMWLTSTLSQIIFGMEQNNTVK